MAWTLSAKPEPRMPAGRAKNDMPIRAQPLASNLPLAVLGYTSP